MLSIIPVLALGQAIYSGKIIDTNTKNPISNAEVYIQGTSVKTTTDNLGRFSFATGINGIVGGSDYELTAKYDKIFWISDKKIDIKIISLMGQETGLSWKSLSGSGEISMRNLAESIYLLIVTCNGTSKTYKISKGLNSLHICENAPITNTASATRLKSAILTADTLVISKNDYYTQKYAYQKADDTYELLKLKYDDIDYLDKLIRPEAFTILQGLPLNPTFGEVKSINVTYSIADNKIYYANSNKYFIHFDFAEKVLGYIKGHVIFNEEQYTKNPNRLYILAIVNHFTASNIFTIEFFAGDELDCSDIETVYQRIKETTYFGDGLKFYANSLTWTTCTNVPIISSDELYKGQNYQPLNEQEGYGYLKKISIDELQDVYLGHHDIVLLNGIPLDISVVSGIITTEFQTPLSHVNVLSHNRGTPNMALRDGWTFCDSCASLRLCLPLSRNRQTNQKPLTVQRKRSIMAPEVRMRVGRDKAFGLCLFPVRSAI